MAGPLYAQLPDIKNALSSTDGGVGTPNELNDAQLTQCLRTASDRVSVYFGAAMDGSTLQSTPPDIFYSLTLDIAVFWAWRLYLKGKVLATGHPAITAYNDAMQMLKDARDGKLQLDVGVPGSTGREIGVVINRISPVFTGDDSNTRINPYTGHLESDVPIGPNWAPRGTGLGPIYQG
jgi:hypothetical protein